MRKTIAIVALACAGLVGCAKQRDTQTAGTSDPMDVTVSDPGVDSLDGAMRYQVSRVDPQAGEVVLVPVEVAEQEIEPQAGQELTLEFQEFRDLTGQSDPSMGDIIQSLQEGGEVIVHSKGLGMPQSADEIDRIELPEPE